VLIRDQWINEGGNKSCHSSRRSRQVYATFHPPPFIPKEMLVLAGMMLITHSSIKPCSCVQSENIWRTLQGTALGGGESQLAGTMAKLTSYIQVNAFYMTGNSQGYASNCESIR